MARPSSIWFRKQTGWYCTRYRGERIKLSKDKAEAKRAFHTLMSKEQPEEEKGGYRPSFKKIADLFLQEAHRTKAEETVKVQTVYLQSFCDFIGNRKADDVKVFHVTEWLNNHDKPGKPRGKTGSQDGKDSPVRFQAWGESTKTTARSILRAAFNWSVEQGYLHTNPIAKLKRGEFAKRERILTAEERKLLREWFPPGIRDFVIAMEQTGARPFSELAKVTAMSVDWTAGTIPLKQHKNAKKGKRRVIYLTKALLKLMKKLAKEHPTGPLFRTRTGLPWAKGSVSKWLRKAERALGLPRLNAYAWRHTFVTDCLAKGMSADVVAELVGNSPASIHKYYSHLEQKRDILKAAAERAVSG